LTFESYLPADLGGYPRRIICLTDETTETIYLLGEENRIVGVSGYTSRPAAARSKPKVSAFTSAKFEKIMALNPDLVLAFSDLQADIVRSLVSRNVPVIAFNQRSVAEILEMILMLGRVLGTGLKAQALVDRTTSDLRSIWASAARFPFRPRVFFEEWKEPLISGIRWVEELIEIAGGNLIFPELRTASAAKERIVTPPSVVERNPDVILASWCGMKVNKDAIRSREGWATINAVKGGNIYEIKSSYILQPGPAALTEGVRQIHCALAKVCGVMVPDELLPVERMDPELSRTMTPF
jgi:iron complex transport system substrate-binding protein